MMNDLTYRLVRPEDADIPHGTLDGYAVLVEHVEEVVAFERVWDRPGAEFGERHSGVREVGYPGIALAVVDGDFWGESVRRRASIKSKSGGRSRQRRGSRDEEHE